MLGRQQIYLELDDSNCSEPEDLTEIMQNVHLNNNFLGLAREVSGEGERRRRRGEKQIRNFLISIKRP